MITRDIASRVFRIADDLLVSVFPTGRRSIRQKERKRNFAGETKVWLQNQVSGIHDFVQFNCLYFYSLIFVRTNWTSYNKHTNGEHV